MAPSLESVRRDLRHGLRLLRRNPAFATLAILVLALGIGTTVGIFSVVDTLLFRQLPYRQADRVVMLWQASPKDRGALNDVSPANCHDWREQLTSFEAIGCAAPSSFDFTGGGEPEVIQAAGVTKGFFEAFGVNPAVGRTFGDEEFLQERNRVVVITYGMWQQKLGGDPNVIGRTIELDRTNYIVVGVLPPTFEPRLLQTSGGRNVYVPRTATDFERRIRGSAFWNAVARLKPGVTMAQAQGELEALSRRLAEQYPRTNADVIGVAQPLRDHLAANMRPALRLLFAAVGLLLLIAAANVANLLLARGAERQRELAVRSAVGAARGRLIRQLLAESLLLATLGSIAGLIVAHWTIRFIVVLSPARIPSLAYASIDGRAIAFAIGLTTIVALVVGVVPAWQSSGGRLLEGLRSTTTGAGGARQPLRATIVIAEVALALLLMTGAGLLLRSFSMLVRTDVGFSPERLIAMQVFAWDRNQTPEQRTAFFDQVLHRMEALPQIQQAGAVSAMPFIEANINIDTGIVVDGRPPAAQGEEPSGFFTVATPGYFETMRIPLRRGRLFTDDDRMRTRPVAVISDTLARRGWPGEDPIGRSFRYRWQGKLVPAEVVGVVGDVRHDALDRPARAEMFVPLAQAGFGSMTFVARTAGDPSVVIEDMKRAIRAIDPQQAIYRAATAEELVSRTLVERRFMLALLSGFALVAGLLAAIGIYGVMSVATTQRTREFGVRLALGAERREIVAMVLRQGAWMAGVGLAIGLAAALTLGRVMSRFLYGVTAADPLTLGAVVAVLATVALAACVVPARRATRVDPLVALRAE